MERVKLQLKYSFRCEARDLYLALKKPSYLQNWMADRVDFDPATKKYTFWWGGSSESARIVRDEPHSFLSWEWVDTPEREGESISFRIDILPEDEWLDLHIEDYCDEMEVRELRADWDEQMKLLERLL